MNIDLRSLLASKRLYIILGPCLFVLLLVIGGPSDMEPKAWTIVACTVWIALWWLTEAVPIAITSLLPILLFSATGSMSVGAVTGYYANNIIYLFIGGFIIALAMERWNLHKRIALNIIKRTGTNQKQILLGFILATGFLSMWISNTATTMMMLPIALSIIDQLARLLSNQESSSSSGFGKALVISIAYAASIGGLATIVGTPTNLIFVEAADQFYGADIPFDLWFFYALPPTILLGGFLWWDLSHRAFKLSSVRVPGSKAIIEEELQQLGPMGYEERWVMVVFSVVAIAWIFRTYLIAPILPHVNDTTIALMGATLLFLVPQRANKGSMIMDWTTAKRLPWEVILLFGGAFSVAGSFQETGLTAWIAGRLTLLGNIHPLLMLIIVVALVNYLTELTQNMATCTLMLPILAGLAQAIGVHPYGLMVPMTLASSCAFMLPVATAPNAIVFGSGTLQMKDMVRAGVWLNIFATLLISIYTYYALPAIWGFDFNSFPAEFVK
jgi:solute carrier family 13 (sodium-dependent dicarboxylate transporter), member 2/3/5